MIDRVVSRWHEFLSSKDPAVLDELLDEDVVFYSPVVFTPQRGKRLTMLYLLAAGEALPGANDDDDRPGMPRSFRYTKEVLGSDTAVLEFETSIGDTYVNGVDIIRANEQGRIVEFRVLVRPLQAMTAVHQQMAATLERMGALPPS